MTNTEKKYSINDLIREYSKFDQTDWESISTQDFLGYLMKKEDEERAEAEEAMDRGSEADQMADYAEVESL